MFHGLGDSCTLEPRGTGSAPPQTPKSDQLFFLFSFFIFDLFHILDLDLSEEQLHVLKKILGKKDSLDQLIPKVLTLRRSAVRLE